MKSLNTRMLVLLLALAVACLIRPGAAIAEDDDTEIIPYDYIDDKGVLKGGMIKVYADDPLHSKYKDPNVRALDSYQEWPFETIIDNGPTGNRVDLVILGDGYDVNDINDGIYQSHVYSIINRFFLIYGFFSQSPLDEYASFFNVHRMDVISQDSGISYDPCDCNCP